MIDFNALKNEMPYKWRIQSFSEYMPICSCVAYVDARQVQKRLDVVCGPENWQSRYEQHKDNLYCSIGIKVVNEWVWKTDCGMPSEFESEKGEASDAFKRAAVQWGIGRFLYDMEIFKVLTDKPRVKGEANPKIMDCDGRTVYNVTEYIERLTDIRHGFSDLKSDMTEKEIKDVTHAINRGRWHDMELQYRVISERIEKEGKK